MKWQKGTDPEKIGWYAGMQYDGDIARAKQVLAKLDEFYPDAKSFEVAGFFWWQGDKDRYNKGHASRYERNLVQLDQNSYARTLMHPTPNLFVQHWAKQQRRRGAERQILDAQLAVDGESGKYKEFKGNVATVYSHPLSKGGASNGHYGGNAETYMNIGEAMGKAMVKLLAADEK